MRKRDAGEGRKCIEPEVKFWAQSMLRINTGYRIVPIRWQTCPSPE